MKIALQLLLLLSFITVNAQIVNIPDANFKNALLNYDPVIDVNNDGEIQVAEAEAITTLTLENENIDDLTGIEAFVNIENLLCSFNNLTTVDISNNTLLRFLYFDNNELTNLNLTSNQDLLGLYISFNNLTELNLDNNVELIDVSLGHNDLTELNLENLQTLAILEFRNNLIETIDVSNTSQLFSFTCSNNEMLTYINLKTGNNENMSLDSGFGSEFINLPNLATVCIDDVFNTELIDYILSQTGQSDINFTEDCFLSTTEHNFVDLKIHPNPTNGVLNVITENQVKEIELFNTLGKSVFTQLKNTERIDIISLQTGVYILKITDANDRIALKQIVKK